MNENNKMTSFLAGMSCFPSERVVKVVVNYKKKRLCKQSFIGDDNTDNMYARINTREREGKRTKIIHRKALSPCRDIESGNRMVCEAARNVT